MYPVETYPHFPGINLWMVQIGYGRIGSRGHTHSHSFETQQEAVAFIAKYLKRLGGSYISVDGVTREELPH